MRVMQKTLSIDLADLQFIGVTCPRCLTEITLDVKSQSADDLPAKCPCCREEAFHGMNAQLSNFKDMYRTMTEADHPKVKFRVMIDA